MINEWNIKAISTSSGVHWQVQRMIEGKIQTLRTAFDTDIDAIEALLEIIRGEKSE